jgi:hypothetical protein
MIYTTIFLGIYILSVIVLVITARLQPNNIYRLHPIILVGLYSFVPALSLGHQMLTTNFLTIITPMPVWFTGGLAGLVVIFAIPCRKWIRRNALDRPMQTARQSMDKLPGHMTALEAKVSDGSMKPDEADHCKFQLQRQMDRLAAIDGTGRFLYLLFKIHLLRLGLQIIGSVAIYFDSDGVLNWRLLSVCSSTFIVDVALIFVPYMLLIVAVTLLNRQTYLENLKI